MLIAKRICKEATMSSQHSQKEKFQRKYVIGSIPHHFPSHKSRCICWGFQWKAGLEVMNPCTDWQSSALSLGTPLPASHHESEANKSLATKMRRNQNTGIKGRKNKTKNRLNIILTEENNNWRDKKTKKIKY